MDIEGRRRSTNIEDRRGMGPAGKTVGLSLGGILVLIVLSVLGINPLPFLGLATKQVQPTAQNRPADKPYNESSQEAKLRAITEVTLADTEETWNQMLPRYGVKYVEPKLVLFTGATQSGCGAAQSATGPFYCPLDQKVYVDMSFYNELSTRFGAPGDFAQAYVIAHEIGHHVQNLTGVAGKVHQAQQRMSKAQANALSVKLELQADCYAGVWAKTADQSRKLLQAGDIESAMRAASAIGDDRMQKQAQGYVMPDSFTHGSSEQRVRWFRRGFDTGTPEQCDTFAAQQL